MADALVKPTAAALEDPEQLLRIIMRLYQAVLSLQGDSDAAMDAASAVGKVEVVVLRGATVTLPGSVSTFTADVYALGVRV